jgi:hypothetical protein
VLKKNQRNGFRLFSFRTFTVISLPFNIIDCLRRFGNIGCGIVLSVFHQCARRMTCFHHHDSVFQGNDPKFSIITLNFMVATLDFTIITLKNTLRTLKFWVRRVKDCIARVKSWVEKGNYLLSFAPAMVLMAAIHAPSAVCGGAFHCVVER